MAYFLISFANIYGNALKKQDEYILFRAGLLMQDLHDKIPAKNTMVIVDGFIGFSKVTQRFIDKYGDISRLLQEYKNTNWIVWALEHFNAPYSFAYTLQNNEICSFLKERFGSEVIFKNAYHTIERVKNCYIITIK